MPEPADYASEAEWMTACVPQLEAEGRPQRVAVAACLNMWRNRDMEGETMEVRTVQGAVEIRMDGDRAGIWGRGVVFDQATILAAGVREIIHPGSISAEVLADPAIVGAINHEFDDPFARVGSPDAPFHLRQDAVGVEYHAPAPAGVTAERMDQLRRGMFPGSSFAFRAEEGDEIEEHDDGTITRHVQAITMIRDMGPVSHPAYVTTTAEARRSLEIVCGRVGAQRVGEAMLSGGLTEPEARSTLEGIGQTLSARLGSRDRAKRRQAVEIRRHRLETSERRAAIR